MQNCWASLERYNATPMADDDDGIDGSDGGWRVANVPCRWFAFWWLIDAIALIQWVSLWWIAVFRVRFVRLVGTVGRCTCTSYSIFNIWWSVAGIMIAIWIGCYDHALWWWCDLRHNTIRTRFQLKMFEFWGGVVVFFLVVGFTIVSWAEQIVGQSWTKKRAKKSEEKKRAEKRWIKSTNRMRFEINKGFWLVLF